jgi:hypothetical protein
MMNFRTVQYTISAVPLLLFASCGLRHASVKDPLPADQLASVLRESFRNADASASEAVRTIVQETTEHDVAGAFTNIKALAALPNLTEAQRITAIRAATTIGQQLQDAAQNGDQQAADTLHTYNGSH